MRYVFTRDITVATQAGNRAFTNGQEIDETEILAGCLASCVRNRTLLPVTSAKVDPPKEQSKPAAKAK